MRIGIVDDQDFFRELLAKVCRQHFGYQVLVQAEAGRAALAALSSTSVDLLVLDLMLPDIDGFEVASELALSACPPKILAISSRCDRYALYRIETAGFDGFLHKDSSIIEDFQRAVEAILNGQTYLSSVFISAREQRRTDHFAFEKLLSPKQHKILCMIGDFMSDQEIAEQLHVSHHAIQKHRFRMMNRLNIRTLHDLLKYTRAYGFQSFHQSRRAQSAAATE